MAESRVIDYLPRRSPVCEIAQESHRIGPLRVGLHCKVEIRICNISSRYTSSHNDEGLAQSKLDNISTLSPIGRSSVVVIRCRWPPSTNGVLLAYAPLSPSFRLSRIVADGHDVD